MGRIRRKSQRANKVYGTKERPRLAVKKTLRHIIAQIVNDEEGRTLAYVFSDSKLKNNIETAKIVGRQIAEKALAAGIDKVVFDRRNYRYHGKVKALADAAREAGLKF